MTEQPGALFHGRYRLEEVVGEGGMAVVWKAEDVKLERTVAVKVLRPQYASDPEFVNRFRSEARAAAALNHPGVVSVHDVGETGDGHFLVLEYVPGTDLKQLIRSDGPLAPLKAVAIGSAMAKAVGHAHLAGLVHRDVKPQNVLLAPDGRVKVADFGIARAVSAVGTTAPGIVLGTVHYLAPEQAAGGPASPASDVYSLGVVLWEMLTGQVPFDADSSVGVAMRIVHEDPPLVDTINPRVPAVLSGIIAKAMARQPEERYPDASALAEALDSFARWSEQATGSLAVAPKGAAPGGPGFGTVGPSSGLAGTRPAAVPQGPLLDGTGVALAAVALASVVGLIPLWLAVVDKVEPTAVRAYFGQAPEPTPLPTATATPEAAVRTEVDVAVPNVVGLDAEAAGRELSSRDLGFSVEHREAPGTQPGIVLEQVPDPAAGPVPAGTVVSLVVSGEPMVVVPNLIGGTYEVAAAELARLGLEPVQLLAWSGAGSAVGVVGALAPFHGSRVPRGSPVMVTVASGTWLGLGVDFEDHLYLAGVDLAADEYRPGQAITLVARWESTGPIQGDYRTVAELVARDGSSVSRDAHVPGQRHTNTWEPGEIMYGDGFALQAPESPGAYRILIGVEANDDAAAVLPVISTTARTVRGKVLVREVTVVAGGQG